eukprot:UN24437
MVCLSHKKNCHMKHCPLHLWGLKRPIVVKRKSTINTFKISPPCSVSVRGLPAMHPMWVDLLGQSVVERLGTVRLRLCKQLFPPSRFQLFP